MSTLERAIAIAAEAHAGQVDKVGEPYILHPLRVMQAMKSKAGRIVGVFHDLVEDCPPWSPEAIIAQGFKPEIAIAVGFLTRPKSVPYENYIERLIRSGPPLSRAVKLQDIRDNLRPDRLTHLPIGAGERLQRKYRAVLLRLESCTDIGGL